MPEAAAVTLIRRHLLGQRETNAYAVLDGASVPDLPQVLWEHEPEHACLYRGELEPDMVEVAPYLVKLDSPSWFTDWVLEQGWGNHWGIFVTTPAEVGLRDLRRHFRKFLMVKDPDGKHLYFRYYDPRALRGYLPTCNAEELEFVFGPLDSFVLEDEDPSAPLRFWLDGGRLRREELAPVPAQ